MSRWFTIDPIDADTYVISEYRHWEESHSYLLNGEHYSLLIDTGLGIENIHEQVVKLTDRPVIAVATHIHWDHIGGHKHFPHFYVHQAEENWLNGHFPLSIEQVKSLVVKDCDLPRSFDISGYTLFQGVAAKILQDQDVIKLGSRTIQVLHTPGHSPGHMCFYEKKTGYLFTGDLAYAGTLAAYYPSTDPEAYLSSLIKVSKLPILKWFPAHHEWNVPVSMLNNVKSAFIKLQSEGRLHHGSGTFRYENFSIRL